MTLPGELRHMVFLEQESERDTGRTQEADTGENSGLNNR